MTLRALVLAMLCVLLVPATALAKTDPKPSAVRSLAATPGDGSVTLTWKAPRNARAAGVNGYRVKYAVAGAKKLISSSKIKKASRSKTISGLTNAVTYKFYVIAYRSKVAGAKGKKPISVTPVSVGGGGGGGGSSGTPAPPVVLTVPGIPRSLTAVRHDGTVDLSWLAPESDGGSPLTGYDLRIKPTSSGVWGAPFNAATSPRTLFDLMNGTSYSFSVRAKNSIGAGDWAATVNATPAGPAPAPTVACSTGPTTTSASWLVTGDGGSGIIGFYFRWKHASAPTFTGWTFSASATSVVIPATAGVVFEVYAYTAVGPGAVGTCSTP